MFRREFLSLLTAAAASSALAAPSGRAQVGLSLSEVSTFGATFGDDVHAYKGPVGSTRLGFGSTSFRARSQTTKYLTLCIRPS
jgi:hypothetical protein